MPHALTCLPRAVFGVPVENVAGADETAETAIARSLVPRLHHCIALLPQREQTTIICHYGLFAIEPRSLRTIAAQTGQSLGSVHRCEARALELLREWL